MKKPIFILGAHKSGTSLLRSLFDAHSDVFTVPIEVHFFQQLRLWVDYSFRKTRPEKLSREQFVNNAKNWVRHCNASEDYQADSVARGLFNLQRFDEAIETGITAAASGCSADLQGWFKAYINAIYYSLAGSELSGDLRIAEKSVENAEFAADLQAMFPDAVFIHIVRNPYANLVSIRKYKSRQRYPWLGHSYRALYNSYYFLHRNRRLISNYHVIRYEDLVEQPKAAVEFICCSVDLAFTDSMLQPSYLGQPWSGNSTSLEQFDGISSARVNAWKSEITSLEIELINRYLVHVVDEFGYQVQTNEKSVFLPVKKESLKEYIANRVLLHVG